MTDHDQARAWAKRLGRVGTWTSDVERLSAAAARDYVRELERLGLQALWIPESLGSKEIFAHAGLLLASCDRLVIASGIANIWARDATAMANGGRTLVEAYPVPELQPWQRAAFLSPAVLSSQWRLFVGYDGDRCVATAAAWLCDTVTVVEQVSVPEEGRRPRPLVGRAPADRPTPTAAETC